jgi:hypothetical protein
MREACKFNVRIHNGNILMSSVTKDPRGLKYLTFQRQRHKLSAPTVGVTKTVQVFQTGWSIKISSWFQTKFCLFLFFTACITKTKIITLISLLIQIQEGKNSPQNKKKGRSFMFNNVLKQLWFFYL